MKLKGKVALITGSAEGIGKQIAKTFAENGAHIVIADINQDKAKDTAEYINNQFEKAIAIKVNVCDEVEVNHCVDEAIANFGKIDILVSNAGIQHIEPIDTLSYESWKHVLGTHLDGAFLTTKACLKHMYQPNHGGSIIYMGSVHSKLASVLKGPYVTAKHGLIGLCKTVAKEGGPHGVRANVICPGYVKTALVERQIPIQAKNLNISEDEVIKKVMLGDTVDEEFTSIADIAEVALFLASFGTNALTGQSLVVSHGWYMQ
jgi:3-hydroxybutyrate dehydrogenase